jgi:hypothetical protein
LDELLLLTPFVFLKDGEACCLFYPSDMKNANATEIQKVLELPGRIGIKNKICLRPSGHKLSAEWQKALSDQGYEILTYSKFMHQNKRPLK